MRKKKIFFLTRFSDRDIQKEYGQEANLSLSRKVLGIMDVLRMSGLEPTILVTDTGLLKNSKKKIFEKDKFNIFIPRKFNVKIRWINYFLNILSTAYEIFKLKGQNSVFIAWDYLPDTLFPLIINRLDKKDIIIDLEERISNDPEANYLFKIFEKIFENKVSENYFASTKKLIPPNKSKSIVMPGFFAENILEEERSIRMVQDKCKNLTLKDTIDIIFTGRFDENRGIDQFLDLAIGNKSNPKYNFQIFGFGNLKKLKKIKKLTHNQKNIEIFYEENRSKLISYLINADVAFNYLNNKIFTSESFPSKIVEQIIFSTVIMSNFKIAELESSRIVLFDGSTKDAKRTLDKLTKNIFFYKDLYIKDIETEKYLTDFSLSNKVKEMKDFFDA